MTHPYLLPIWVLSILAIFTSCLAPFEGEIAADRLPIINGVLTNSSSQRTLRVARTDGFTLTPELLTVSGTVFENGEAVGVLIPLDTGLLKLPDELVIKADHTYHIELETAEGERFVTRPQTVVSLPSGSVQSLGWERAVERDQGANAAPRNVVRVFSEIEVQSEAPRYFRWETAETWMHREVPVPERQTILQIDSTRDVTTQGWIYDTTYILVTDPLQICYPSREVTEFPSTVVRTDELQEGRSGVLIHRTEIGQTFIFQHYFRSYLHPITFEAYEYYRKSQRLVDIEGELYDEIPAAVNGNLFNPADSTTRILGFVEFSLVDTALLSINQDDLGLAITNDCDNIGPFGPCSQGGPCKCFDCDLIYGAETLNKPEWWVD